LEREIGSICRKIATQIGETKEYTSKIGPKEVRTLLGKQIFIEGEEVLRRTSIPGVATGLAWTPFGGEILFIEATRMPGANHFQITGSIGEVMQESAQAALSYVRSHAVQYGIQENFYNTTDIHLHIPSGAQPKDGPSAGVTLVTALVSLLTDKPVRPDVGMTGEISLSGQVLPIGGLKEKALAAYRGKLKTLIIPKHNQRDLDELPKEVIKAIRFIPVDTIQDVLSHAINWNTTSRTNAKKGNA
jgi:ATP-dependent Lon protease